MGGCHRCLLKLGKGILGLGSSRQWMYCPCQVVAGLATQRVSSTESSTSAILTLTSAPTRPCKDFSSSAIWLHRSVALHGRISSVLAWQADQDLLFQPILPLQDVYALAVGGRTVLALWSFAGALDFVRATLDTGAGRQKLGSRRDDDDDYGTHGRGEGLQSQPVLTPVHALETLRRSLATPGSWPCFWRRGMATLRWGRGVETKPEGERWSWVFEAINRGARCGGVEGSCHDASELSASTLAGW